MVTGHLVVVGLGLIGGSLARATKVASPGSRITGVDRQLILDVATDEGFIDDGVTIENAAESDNIFSMLMGDDVPPRREFIEANAKYANIDA